MNFLWIQTAFLGDLILTLPAIARVRRQYPNSVIWIIARNEYCDFLEKLDLGIKALPIIKNDKASYQKSLKLIQDLNFETVFIPHRSFTSFLLSRKVKARNYVGFHALQSLMPHSHKIPYPFALPEALRVMSLTAFNEAAELTRMQEWKGPEIPDSWTYQPFKSELGHQKVLIAPGSQWPTKRWPAEKYAKLTHDLISQGFQIQIIGHISERPIGEDIQALLPPEARLQVINSCGQLSLYELLELMAKARALYCGDTGSMHMGSLIKNLTVHALFGPTTLELGYRPWTNSAEIHEISLACRPCNPHGPSQCPLGDLRCQREISV